MFEKNPKNGCLKEVIKILSVYFYLVDFDKFISFENTF